MNQYNFRDATFFLVTDGDRKHISFLGIASSEVANGRACGCVGSRYCDEAAGTGRTRRIAAPSRQRNRARSIAPTEINSVYVTVWVLTLPVGATRQETAAVPGVCVCGPRVDKMVLIT